MASSIRLEIEVEKLLPEDLVNIYKAFCRSYGFVWEDKRLDYLRREGIDTLTKIEIGGPITQRNILIYSPGGYNHFMGIRISNKNSDNLKFIFGAYKTRKMDRIEELKSTLFREKIEKLFPRKVSNPF